MTRALPLPSHSPKPRPLPAQLAITALTLCLAIGFGTVMRLQATADELWVDELHTAWAVGGELHEVADRAARGNQSPLYFWIVYLAVQWGGLDAVTLRALSFACGILLIPGVAWFLYRWTSSPLAAVCGGWLTALDPSLVFFASEARPYAAVQLLALLQMSLFMGRVTSPVALSAWRRAAFILATMLLVYLHYTALLLIIAQLGALIAIGAVHWRSRLRRQVAAMRPANDSPPTGSSARLLIDFLIAFVLCTVALVHLAQIGGVRHQWATTVSLDQFWNQLLYPTALYILFPGLVVVSTHVLFCRRAVPDQRLDSAPNSAVWICTIAWALVPVALVTIGTAVGIAPLAMVRYVAGSLVAAIVLAGMLVALSPKLGARSVMCGGLAALALLVNPLVIPWWTHGQWPRMRFEAWSQVAAEINMAAPDAAHAPVFVCANLVEDWRLQLALPEERERLEEYLTFPFRGIYTLDSQRPLVPVSATPPRFDDSHVRMAAEAGGCWLVVRGSASLAHHIAVELYYALAASDLEVSGSWIEIPGDVRVLRVHVD